MTYIWRYRYHTHTQTCCLHEGRREMQSPRRRRHSIAAASGDITLSAHIHLSKEGRAGHEIRITNSYKQLSVCRHTAWLVYFTHGPQNGDRTSCWTMRETSIYLERETAERETGVCREERIGDCWERKQRHWETVYSGEWEDLKIETLRIEKWWSCERWRASAFWE